MSEPMKCPECQAIIPPNAPASLCPKCLFKAGLRSAPSAADSNASSPTMNYDNAMDLPDSDQLAQHFPELELGDLLGRGGMGAVFKARQKKLDRQVALKIILPGSAHDPAFAERFNREARTLARLSHSNIVGVHDFGDIELEQTDGSPTKIYFFLMELVDGANLRQLIQAGELESNQALSIITQICDALQYAHDEGVVHRDIKPENILVDRHGRVKIADFGLAKMQSDKATDYTLTGTHQVMGTPRYMAPEQMEGSRSVDHRADIYSLGVVFYEMLTGELPLGRFDPPSKKAVVDQRWDEVVLRALEKEPQKRYQHASEVKSKVEQMDQAAPDVAVKKLEGQSAADSNLGAPHFGLGMLGLTMTVLGLTMLGIAISPIPQNRVFAFIGMGLAIGGPVLASLAFVDGNRMPAGVKHNMPMMIPGLMMSFVGMVCIVFAMTENRTFSFDSTHAFTWIGCGLFIGGGGFCAIAWEAHREEKKKQQSNESGPAKKT